jgi:hypothetical protein
MATKSEPSPGIIDPKVVEQFQQLMHRAIEGNGIRGVMELRQWVLADLLDKINPRLHTITPMERNQNMMNYAVRMTIIDSFVKEYAKLHH